MNTVDLSWLKATPFAHRGLHTGDEKIPENSMKAFKNAIEHNYAIELDVQVTKQKQVVVFHDEDLARMCGGHERSITTVTSDELQHFYRLQGTEQKIPLLSEVLACVNGRVPILIEIKPTRVKNACRIILNELIGYTGLLAIQSFDPFILGWFANRTPRLIRGQLACSFKEEQMNAMKKYLLRTCKLNIISKPHFFAYNATDMPVSFLERKRKNGTPVLGWTITSTEEQKKASQYCDNIIFEGYYAANG